MAKRKKLPDRRKLRDFFTAELADARTAAPACPHFGECGGCAFQDVPYERQLRAKRSAFDFIAQCVREDFREQPETARTADLLAEALDGVSPDVVPSPLRLGYRQRMDYVFAFGCAGLRRANRHRQVVTLEACPLLGEQGFGVFQKALRLARGAGIPDYDYLRHTGDLRYFVVRRSRNGQTLLSLVTKTAERGEAVLSVLRALFAEGAIASGHWLLAEGLGDVSFGAPRAVVGSPWIEETMNGIRLRIGPNTFFQSNPAVAEKAYAAIAGFVPPGGRVLDMYSGVGSIAASLAGAAGSVTAVENVPENVALARENIAANRLENVLLAVDDAARYLVALAGDPALPRPDLVVVNPPRPGVGGDGMAAIAALAPPRVAYLSCNPFTLLRDLASIPDAYRIHSLAVYDMFPQTRHFETLALLERK